MHATWIIYAQRGFNLDAGSFYLGSNTPDTAMLCVVMYSNSVNTMGVLHTSVPLIESCTKEELYAILEELGENTAALRKKDAAFKELEKLYYKRLGAKLKEMHTQSTSVA